MTRASDVDTGVSVVRTVNPDPDAVLFAETPAVRLGAKIRRRRTALDINQTQLGELAYVSRTTIRAVETGNPVEARTLDNVVSAVACSTVGGGISDVFSIGAARALVTAVLSVHTDARAVAINWYLDLVRTCAAGEEPTFGPPSVLVFEEMPGVSVDAVQEELSVFGSGPRTRPANPLSELRIVLASDLPAAVQSALVTHMQGRRAAMETALADEARMMVEQIRANLAPDASRG